MSRVITLLPVRMAATRLPNKPLLDVNGKSIIQRVCENVKAAIDTDIAVAAGDQAIVDECNKFGVTAILTDPALPSGTDRIAAALKLLDPDGSKYDIVVDFQGDNLNVDPKVNLPLIEMIERTDCDIATCGMVIKNEADKSNPAAPSVLNSGIIALSLTFLILTFIILISFIILILLFLFYLLTHQNLFLLLCHYNKQ